MSTQGPSDQPANPLWTSDTLGGIEDVVQLTIGDAGTTHLCEQYDVRQAFFTSSPNVWAVKLGVSAQVSQLLKLGVPRQRIELRVGGSLQQTGWTDGPEADADANGGTTVTIHGRDKMADLHDAHVTADKTFKNMSFADLTEAVLTQAIGADFDFIPLAGNLANRMVVTGGAPPPATPDADISAALTTPKNNDLKVKFGEKWFEFLKRQLDRAGLFLITGGSGEFILCAPNAKQDPSYQIIRQAGQTRNTVATIKAHYRNTATGRFTTYIVHGRGGGSPSSNWVSIPDDAPDDVKAALLASAGSGGQKPITNQYVDPEMVAWGFPPGRAWTHKDPHVTTTAACIYLAKKKAADERRKNWQLIYTVPGLTWPSSRAGGKRITWAIDTIVKVIDDDFGLNGNYWIESVAFQRGAQGTTTVLQLMRPEDLVFGDPTSP